MDGSPPSAQDHPRSDGEDGQFAATDRTLREQRDELARANERLEAFAGTVAHELRTPLGVASGYTQQLAAEYDDDRLAKVVNAHGRMEDLLVDLLDLARAGGEVPEPEWVDLEATARTSWETVRTADATLATPTSGAVRCDRSRLRQLLSNLVENAVDHGGEDVTVTVGDLPDGFYVADDGAGVPAGERDRVFERGYTTEDDGTGFGLGIVRDVARAHDWRVDLTTGADGGARFEVTDVERRDD